MQEMSMMLEDGRQLAFAFYGPEQGVPVFYFHGTPSSRLEPLLLEGYGTDLETLLLAADIKLIAVDRPGMGLSDFNNRGDFLSFADDVNELASYLNISNSQVLCWSGGGPYALALACKYPSLATGCHIICGFSRKFDKYVERLMGMNKWYFKMAKRAPALLQTGMNLLQRKKATRSLPQWITGLPYADYELIKDPAQLELLSVFSMKEAARKGARGPVYEAKGYYRDLGFQLSDIHVPVHYWWGTLDMSVIRLHAEEVEDKIAGAVMHYREHEGHLSLYVHCFKDVLDVISAGGGKGIA
jgi:pimeloyl-ACP methyl ester carboxylesterase